MISEIDGSTLNFGGGRFLHVLAEDREKVECILMDCSCVGEWTAGVSSVTPYSDTDNEIKGVSLWTLFIENYEDVKRVQVALDAA